MTALINQIQINGDTTTFLNYVNPISDGENLTDYKIYDQLFAAQFGPAPTLWKRHASYPTYSIRFPVPWETLSGDINDSHTTSRATVHFEYSQYNDYSALNSTTAASGMIKTDYGYNGFTGTYRYAVLNNYSFCFIQFSGLGRTSTLSGLYIGWPKDFQYTGTQFPRNLIVYRFTDAIQQNSFRRVELENQTTLRALIKQNPTLNCEGGEVGANSTDVIIRDSVYPYHYLGKLWNMLILPATAEFGKIYRNTGPDPDTGLIENDQKAFWMCVGSHGIDKIGMRVWTEDIE